MSCPCCYLLNCQRFQRHQEEERQKRQEKTPLSILEERLGSHRGLGHQRPRIRSPSTDNLNHGQDTGTRSCAVPRQYTLPVQRHYQNPSQVPQHGFDASHAYQEQYPSSGSSISFDSDDQSREDGSDGSTHWTDNASQVHPEQERAVVLYEGNGSDNARELDGHRLRSRSPAETILQDVEPPIVKRSGSPSSRSRPSIRHIDKVDAERRGHEAELASIRNRKDVDREERLPSASGDLRRDRRRRRYQ